MNLLQKLTHWTAREAARFSALLSAAFDLRDLFWIGGLAAAGYGITQIHVPAAWIICGAAVFWMGIRR